MKCFQDFDPSAKRLCSIEPFTMMALGGAAGGVGDGFAGANLGDDVEHPLLALRCDEPHLLVRRIGDVDVAVLRHAQVV